MWFVVGSGPFETFQVERKRERGRYSIVDPSGRVSRTIALNRTSKRKRGKFFDPGSRARWLNFSWFQNKKNSFLSAKFSSTVNELMNWNREPGENRANFELFIFFGDTSLPDNKLVLELRVKISVDPERNRV